MEKLNSEQIKEMCRIQHKMFVSRYLISKMPLAYTNMTFGDLERDVKIRSINEECEKQMNDFIKKHGKEIIINTFSDKDYVQKEENRFTFEEQRQATKEVIGKELTLEEVFEKY